MSAADGWVEGPGILCEGLRIGFRATERHVLREIPAIFLPEWKSSTGGTFDFLYFVEVDHRALQYRAYLDETETIVAPTLTEFLDLLRLHLQHAIAEHSTEHIFVHAGVVAWQEIIILIPGRSHSGKSMLVRELIRAGAVYFSDEFALIDDRGMVHPFARPLSLRSGSERTSYDPRHHSEPVGASPLPVGLIVLAPYMPPNQWNPAYISPGEALLELAQNTVSIRANPKRVLSILKNVVSSAIAVKSPREEASQIVPNILTLSSPLYR